MNYIEMAKSTLGGAACGMIIAVVGVIVAALLIKLLSKMFP